MTFVLTEYGIRYLEGGKKKRKRRQKERKGERERERIREERGGEGKESDKNCDEHARRSYFSFIKTYFSGILIPKYYIRKSIRKKKKMIEK